jgi:hypothetical protein
MQTINDNNEFTTRNLVYNGLSLAELPGNDKVFEDIKYMVEDIKECENLESFEDDYSGPVLFMDDAAITILETALFNDGNKLIAHRKPLKRNDQFMPDNNINEDKSKTWELGDKVIDSDISVVDYSSLNEYDGVKLWGHYAVDAEGIVPPDSLLLIKDGILKGKYNDRTPTEYENMSNGHKRSGLGNTISNRTMAPATLKIEAKNTLSNEELKSKLLEYAKEEGYDYGIIIRPATINSSNAVFEYYKVDAETGSETRLNNVTFKSISDREFKRIAGVSDKLIVKNKLFNRASQGLANFQSMMPYSSSGVPVTYIAPSALLIERVDVKTNKMRIPAVKPVVKSPLTIH